MKQLILMCAFLAISSCCLAQYDTSSAKSRSASEPKKDSIIYPEKTCVTMHNGQVMMFKNGDRVPIEQAMVLQNGTIVLLNGMVKTKEGKVSEMNEGDCLDMYGETLPLDTYKNTSQGPPKNKLK